MSYPNGRIPTSELVAVPNYIGFAGGFGSVAPGSNLLLAVAARQHSEFMRRFFERFKRRLLVREAYRPIPVQDLYYDRFYYRKPGWTLAAYPGTSPHGRAISCDYEVEGVGDPSGEYLAWMRETAAELGIVNDVPSETWHWSYRPDVAPPKTVAPAVVKPNPAPAPAGGTNPTGDNMNTEIIRVDASGRTKKTGSYDSFLRNTETMRCMHLATSTQETYHVNIGIKINRDIQPRSVLDNYEQVKGKGAAV